MSHINYLLINIPQILLLLLFHRKEIPAYVGMTVFRASFFPVPVKK